MLTESSSDADPLVAGRHYAAADAAGLGGAALGLARDPSAAAALAAEAYEYIRADLPLSRAAAALAETVAGVLAGGGGSAAGRGMLAASAARARLWLKKSVPSRGPERPPMPDLEGSVPEMDATDRFVWIPDPGGEPLPAAPRGSRRCSRGGCRRELLLWAGCRCRPRDPQPAPVGVERVPAPPVMVRADAMRTAVSGGEETSQSSSTASCRTPTRRASTFSASSRSAPRAGCRTPSPTPRAGSGA